MATIGGAVMSKGALLHDVGMSSVPDHVLLKPGPLDAQDLVVLKKHVGAGLAAIEGIEMRLGRPHAALRLVKEMALSHHERWDGAGYPQGLAGEAIPPSARVIALVDAYLAMTSRRVFRAPMSHAHAVAQLRAGRCRDFDPGVLDAFLGIEAEFEAITRPFSDTEMVASQRP